MKMEGLAQMYASLSPLTNLRKSSAHKMDLTSLKILSPILSYTTSLHVKSLWHAKALRSWYWYSSAAKISQCTSFWLLLIHLSSHVRGAKRLKMLSKYAWVNLQRCNTFLWPRSTRNRAHLIWVWLTVRWIVHLSGWTTPEMCRGVYHIYYLGQMRMALRGMWALGNIQMICM